MKSIEKAALILAEAEFATDDVVAARWGISVRTIYTYRAESAKDPKLAEMCRQKVKEISDRSTEAINKYLNRSLERLSEIIDKSIDKIAEENLEQTVELIKAVTLSIDKIGGLKLGSEVLNVPRENNSDAKVSENSTGNQEEVRAKTRIIPPKQWTPDV
jgi:hypothetical protein